MRRLTDVAETDRIDRGNVAHGVNSAHGAARAAAQSCTHLAGSGYPENALDPPCHPSHRTRPEDREALRVMTHDAAKWLAALALARKEADY
jgi:hypothetical protein